MFATDQKIEETNQTLQDIKSLMERSTKFLSLSGISGVLSGIFALIGSGFVHYYWGEKLYRGDYYQLIYTQNKTVNYDFLLFCLADASLVLLFSLGVATYFAFKNAKRQNLKVWNKSTQQMLESLLIPLVTGGLFCLILADHHEFEWIPSCTLIFYGLALINAGKFTYGDVRNLGIAELILGLAASVWLNYGLLFWTIGFGILHIIYGFWMYQKYEKNA